MAFVSGTPRLTSCFNYFRERQLAPPPPCHWRPPRHSTSRGSGRGLMKKQIRSRSCDARLFFHLQMMLKTRGRVEALCRLRTLVQRGLSSFFMLLVLVTAAAAAGAVAPASSGSPGVAPPQTRLRQPDFPRALVHPAPEVIVDTFSERQTALESFSLLRDFGRSVDFLAPDFHDREVQAYFAPLAGGFVALAKRNTMYRVMHMVPPKNADVGASEWMGNQIADLSARVLQVGTLEKNLGSCLAASHDAPKIVDQSGGASTTTSTATDGDEQQQADVEHTNQESADPTTIVTIDPSFGLPGQGRVDNTRIIAQTGGGRSSEEENKGIAAALEEIASLVHAIMELQPTTTGSKSSASISSVSATTTSSTSSSTDVVPRLFSELAIRLAKFETVLAFSEDLSFADFYLYKVAALFDRIASKILYVVQEALKNYEKLYCTEKLRFVDDTVKEKFANDIAAGLLARLGGALLEDEIEAGLGLEQVEDINLEQEGHQRLKPLIAAAVGELRERISVAFRSDLLEKDFSVREDGHEVLPQHFSTDIRFCPHSDKLLRGLLRSAAETWASALTDVTDMAASMSAETGKVIAAFSTLFSVSSSSPGGAGSKEKKLADFLFRRGALAPFFDGTAPGGRGARAGGGSSTEEPEQDPVATIQEDFVAFWAFARDSLGVGAGRASPIAKLDPAKVLTGEQRLVLSSDDIIAAAPAAAVLKKATEEQLYDEPDFTTSSSSWTPHQQALDAVRVLGRYSTEALQAAGAGGRLLSEALETSYSPPALRVAAAFVRLTKLDFVLRNAKRQQRHIEFLKRMTNRVSDSLLRGSCLAGLFSRLLQIDGEHPEFVQRKQKLAAAAARRGELMITPLQEATELVRTRLDIFEWQALHFFFHMVKQSNVRHLREGKSPVAFAQNGQNPNDYSDQWLSVEYHEDYHVAGGAAPDPGSRNNGIEGYFRSKYLLQTITGEHERISMTETGFVTEYHHALMHQAGHKFNPFLCYQLGQPLPPLIGAAAASGAAAVDDEAASSTIESRGPAPSSLASSSVTRFWTATPNLRDPVSGRKYSPGGSSKFREFPKWHTQRQSLILNSTAIRLMDPFVMAPPREEIIPADSSFLESVTPLSNLEVRLQCTYPLLRVPACLLEKQRLRYFKDFAESVSFVEVLREAARLRWGRMFAVEELGGGNKGGSSAPHSSSTSSLSASSSSPPTQPVPPFVGFALKTALSGLGVDVTGRASSAAVEFGRLFDAYQLARGRTGLLQYKFHDDTCVTHYDWVVFLLRKLLAARRTRTSSSYVMKPLQTISIGVFLAAVETRVLQDEELRDSVYFHLIDPWPEGQRNIPGLQDFRTSTTQSSGYDDVCRGDTACAAKVVQELQKHVPRSRSANAAFTSTSATRPPSGVGGGVPDSVRPEADEQEHKSYEWSACGDGTKDHNGARTSGRSAGSGSAIFDFCSYADARVQVSSPSSPSRSVGSTTSATDHSSDDWCLAHAGSVHTLSLGSLSTAHDDCVALVRGSLAGQRKMVESRAEKNTFQVFQEFAQDIHTFFAGNSSDFIFVDGDHSEAGVRADLEYYFWKVKKPGGILAGHDLGLFTFPGMAHGVLGFFHELLHGYCAGLGIRTSGAKADGARDELFSTLEPYCETGLTINVSSDYVYWIEF